MKTKSNVWTIIRKEFARFFGDRTLVFTSVIMPGLLIYIIYTLMGTFMYDKIESDLTASEPKTEFVSPLTEEETRLMDSLNGVYAQAYATYEAEQEGLSETEELGTVLGNLIPVLILMLLYSGCMAVAPAAIAGEKERGTIATLLVTPMKRWELAIGKIVSLSCFSLLSGLSSFVGIILSLPNMFKAEEVGLNIEGGLYSANDYLLLFLLIVSTVLIIISAISILSAWAKDVKSAGTMIMPLMLFIMMAGLTPMISNAGNSLLYLIPIYNSAQAMSAVLSFKFELVPLLITIGSNLVYTGLAVFVLTKMFNSEKVMFSK